MGEFGSTVGVSASRYFLECLGDTSMPTGPATGREVLVNRVPDQSMPELIAFSAQRRRLDDERLQRFFYRVEKHALIRAGERTLNHLELELPPDHRGRHQKLIGRIGQPAQPSRQRSLHTVGNAESRSWSLQQARDLRRKERVAFGAAVHQPDEVFRRMDTHHHRQQPSDIGLAQAAKLHSLKGAAS